MKDKWKRRKEQFDSAKSCDLGDTQTMGELNPTTHTKSKPRKSVTWADVVTEALENGEVVQRPVWLVKEGDCEQDPEFDDAPQDDTQADQGPPHGPVGTNVLSEISDWDSDLSDLTDTDESASANEARVNLP